MQELIFSSRNTTANRNHSRNTSYFHNSYKLISSPHTFMSSSSRSDSQKSQDRVPKLSFVDFRWSVKGNEQVSKCYH